MTYRTPAASRDDQRLALLNGAGMIDRTESSRRIRHTGADALDLLHRITTNDLLSMQDGEARPTVFCSEKGRVIGVFTVLRQAADDLLLVVDSDNVSELLETIDKYTIIEDAELSDISGATAHFAVAGPRSEAAIDAAGIKEVTVVRHSWPAAMQRTDVLVPLSDREPTLRALQDAGAMAVTIQSWEVFRIEHGVPALQLELDDSVNPLEAGLFDLINFEKGCYIGQEVVARLDTYDKLQRHLVGLRANSPLKANTELQAGGRSVGRITSVAQSPRFGSIALAYIRRGHWNPGTTLDANGIPATVTSLPFA